MSSGGRRWRILALVAVSQMMAMSVWFTASAVAPRLQELWGLDPARAGWLTTSVQLGFVAGTAVAALLNLADVVPARSYVTVCMILASASNAGLAFAPGFGEAAVARAATGFFLAGVYPPAMKMLATWFTTGRGLAIGTLIGALTVGKAVPYLMRVAHMDDHRHVVLTASALCLAGAAILLSGYHDGPHPFPRHRFSWGRAREVLSHRPTRLAIGGYLGHMWELYAMWTWIPAFLAAGMAAGARAAGAPAGTGPEAAADLAAFLAIAAGGAGCVWGGWQADRIGRERLVNLAMGASGGCCLIIGLLFGAPIWAVASVACVWGFFVVADSAQFSTLVTEVAPRHAVGTALTLQTSMGFLLTVAAIQLVPWLAQTWGWRWAFAPLAAGPALGIVSILRLQRARSREAAAAQC